jgi:lysophospholipase
LAHQLVAHKIDSFWIDLPGHGRSEGRRADISRAEDYVHTIEALVRVAEREGAVTPMHLFGHSLGGLSCIRFLQTSALAQRMKSVCLSAPLLGLGRYPSKSLGLMEWALAWLPNFTLNNKSELGESCLTHSEEAVRRRKADPLINHLVTIRWVREFLRARKLAFQDSSKFQTPSLWLVAGEDLVVDSQETKRFIDLIGHPKKQMIEYPGMWHELLNEIHADKVRGEIIQWLKANTEN